MTTAADLTLLQQIVDLVDAGGADATDTETLAGASGRATFGPPWFGMHDSLGELEREGLLTIDERRAAADQPDQPAPAGQTLSVAVTAAGRAALEPRNSE